MTVKSRLKSLFELKEGYVVPNGEKFSYFCYFTGQNTIYNLIAGFLTAFLLFQDVDVAKSATVMLAVKIWDACNDAIFGAVFDKVKFKSKLKFLPWLRISVAFIPLATVFLFAMPQGLAENAKLAWFAVAYIVWDTVYTLCDAPLYGIVTSMTDCVRERETMMSIKGIFANAGMGLTTLVTTLLISEKVGSNYATASVVIAVIAFATMLPLCIKGKERVLPPPAEEQFTVRRMLRYLFKNKYLLIFYAAFFFSSGLNVMASLNLFVSFYVFDNSLFSLVAGAISIVPYLIFALLVPVFIKRMNKITLYKLSLILSVAVNLVVFFAAYRNFTAYIVLTTVNSIPSAVAGVLLFMFTPDCAEYGKFKSGIEARGITFCLQTFMAKLTGALSGALGLYMLKFFDWKEISAQNFQELEQLAAQGITQSDGAVKGLWFTFVILPVIGNAIAFLILQLYKLKDRDVQFMTDCNTGKISREEALSNLSYGFKKREMFLAEAGTGEAEYVREATVDADDSDGDADCRTL